MDARYSLYYLAYCRLKGKGLVVHVSPLGMRDASCAEESKAVNARR